MAKRKSTGVEMDLSSFMAVLIMTIGCMVVILVSNVIIIVSNPDNSQITSIIKSSIDGQEDSGTPFPLGNTKKEPTYIDIQRDYLQIYPGEHIVRIRDLTLEGNAFEQLIDRISTNTANEYIVLLVRPDSVRVSRQLRKSIDQRNIDIGFELFRADRKVDYEKN